MLACSFDTLVQEGSNRKAPSASLKTASLSATDSVPEVSEICIQIRVSTDALRLWRLFFPFFLQRPSGVLKNTHLPTLRI